MVEFRRITARAVTIVPAHSTYTVDIRRAVVAAWEWLERWLLGLERAHQVWREDTTKININRVDGIASRRIAGN